VYRHFEDKEDLLAAVAAECALRLDALTAEALAKAPDHPLEQFRAQGISIVRFAAAHPEHYRVLCVPGMTARIEGARERFEADRQKIAAAQAAGLVVDLPTDDVMLAAQAAVSGLAHMIIEGQLGPVDDQRATELAIAVTGMLGVGLIPRTSDVLDPYKSLVIKGRKKR
jgi:AcrR family transcriptional regulator